MLTQLDGTLTGTLAALQQISGAVSGTGTVSGTLTIGGGGDYPAYTGEYIVTPTVEAQTLDTRLKVMTDDLTVLEIPYYETTNLSGGYTAIIGG